MPTDEPSAPPILDIGAVTALADQLGHADAVAVVDLFVAAAPGRDADLAQAHQADDVVRAARLAHTLRSTADLLGARRLSAAALRLQTAGDVVPPDLRWRAWCADVRTELAAAVDALGAWRSGQG